jgi:hypothetical protein
VSAGRVLVVMPTRDRPVFAALAVEMFEARNPKLAADLVIVDSGRVALVPEIVRGHERMRAPWEMNPRQMIDCAIAAHQHEIVIRHEDDDFYAPAWYQAAADAASESASGIVGVTDFYGYRARPEPCACRWVTWGQDPALGEWSGGCCAFRRSLWEKAEKGGPNGWGEDRAFVLDMQHAAGMPRELVPGGTNMFVHIRHHENDTKGFPMPKGTRADLAAVSRIMGPVISFYSLIGPPVETRRKRLPMNLAARGR